MKSSCYLNVDPSPPASTSHPPDVIHVMQVFPGLPCFSLLFCFHVLYGTKTEEQNWGGLKTGLIIVVVGDYYMHFEHSPTTFITVEALPLIP